MTAEKNSLSAWFGERMGKAWFQAILVLVIAAAIGGAAVFSLTVWPNKGGLTVIQSWYLWLSVLVVVFVWFYGIKIPWVRLTVREMKDAYSGLASEQASTDAPSAGPQAASGSHKSEPQGADVDKES